MPAPLVDLLQSAELPRRAVIAVVVDGREAVAFRTESGVACVVQRSCPHLDWDLADAVVQGEALLCPGHGWSIGCGGRVFKRNEFGREDAKGEAMCWPVAETDGVLRAATTPGTSSA